MLIFFQIQYIVNLKGLFQEKFDPVFHQKLYSQSQYVMKNPISVIPDEIVYAHAGWEYLHGRNPIMLNAEQPPIGKYLIGLSEKWFGNSRITGPIFNLLLLFALFLLSNILIKSKFISVFIVLVFSFEKLFLAQIRYSPLLDNIQVTFILFSFYFFAKEHQKNNIFFLSLVFLGLVVSTKFWITGVVIYLTFLTFLLINRDLNKLLKFIIFSPVIGFINIISYFPAFVFHNLSFREYLGLQKYIYVWHSGKLQPDLLAPFDLLILNKWHHMDKIVTSVDWQITWPLVTLISFLGFIFIKKITKQTNSSAFLLYIFISYYFVLLIFSDTNARYLFPILPFLYLLSFWTLKQIVPNRSLSRIR